MQEHAVVIAGGGPTGLMLAGELALAGVDAVVVERRPNQDLAGQRAGGLLSRTIEVLDQRGIADRFISQGQKHQVTMFAGTSFISDLPTRHNYVLGLWQNHIERILAGWVGELKVPIHYGIEVTGFTQDDAGVDVQLSDGQSLRAQYLVGCDGGRSLIRKAAGIEFPGWDPTIEQPDRRGRVGRGAGGMGHPPRRPRHPFPRQDGGWGAGTRSGDRTARRSHDRTHPARPERGAHRRIRHRLRRAQSHVALQVHRHDSAGRGLPRQTSPAGRRRRAHSSAGRWTGHPDRCAGCGEPGMEAGAGGQRDIAREPARYLPRRAPPRRCARAAQHDGAGDAPPSRRAHDRRCATPCPRSSSWTSPADDSPR